MATPNKRNQEESEKKKQQRRRTSSAKKGNLVYAAAKVPSYQCTFVHLPTGRRRSRLIESHS